jgi:hypothetical protein
MAKKVTSTKGKTKPNTSFNFGANRKASPKSGKGKGGGFRNSGGG